MEKKLLAVSIFACLLGGCATTTKNQTASDRDEGTYVTGSRLPQKTGGTAPVGQASQEEWQRQNRGQMGQPAGSGK